MPKLAMPAEEKLAGSLLRHQASDTAIILKYLPQYGATLQPYPRAWIDIEAETQKTLRKGMRDTFRQAAQALAIQLNVNVDPAELNEAADNWAWEHSTDVAKGVTQTIAKRVNEAVKDLDQSMPPNARAIAVRHEVGNILNYDRYSRIAATETTRAAAAGENWIAARFNRGSQHVIPVWQTSQDEKTCYICAPLHNTIPVGLEKYGVDRGEKLTATRSGWDALYGDGPPAHPNCRCSLLWTPVDMLRPNDMAKLKPRKPKGSGSPVGGVVIGPTPTSKMAKLKRKK